MNAPVIELDDIHKVYETGAVQVHASEACPCRSPRRICRHHGRQSGSGKSTLMNILGCLDRPTDGRYLPRRHRRLRARTGRASPNSQGQKLGFVFQGFNLLARTRRSKTSSCRCIYAGDESRAERDTRR